MSAEGLRAFKAAVVADPSLVARLRPITDREPFIAAALEAARQLGFSLERSEIEAEMREGHRVFLTAWLPHV